MKIVFFGSSNYVIPVIETIKKNFDLSLVITTEQNPSTLFLSSCIKSKIPNISVSDLSDPTLNSQLSTLNSEIAILADFGLIIPKKVLKIFPRGIINIHPSLLPKYRGPAPVQSAILNGEKITGVSVIRLDDRMDHGPILCQKNEKILPNDTSETLYLRLFKIGSDLIYQTIKQYIKGGLKPQEQDHSKATFTKLLRKSDGQINVDNPPSFDKLNKMIRAFYPWPGVWTKFRGSTRGVEAQKIIKLLPGQKIQVEGKNLMSYKDFINGYQQGKEILKKLDLI